MREQTHGTRIRPGSPAALESVDRRRQRVIGEIGLPAWYWWGIALGWVMLGVIADLQHPWFTSAAPLLFGAVHASIAPAWSSAAAAPSS